MKFTLISDMHVDFPQEKTPYDLFDQHVVVAGDTSNGLEGLRFLDKIKRKGFDVHATYGNHEHYKNRSTGRSHHETSARFREEHSTDGELEPGLPIALRCGWYVVQDEPLWQSYMNDSRMSCMSAEDVNKEALDDAFYLEQSLMSWSNHGYSGVVVTHMAPCLETLNQTYADHYSQDWYWSPYLGKLLKKYSKQIRVWCHGHSHASADKIVDGVRVVCNPRGYPGENPYWEPLTVEV
jgi:predicted phosphodiesterase